jgi:hypothetical protein
MHIWIEFNFYLYWKTLRSSISERRKKADLVIVLGISRTI